MIIKEVQQHQHRAAHDHKHTNHDGGDVNNLLIVFLGTVVSLVLQITSANTHTDKAQNSSKKCYVWTVNILGLEQCALERKTSAKKKLLWTHKYLGCLIFFQNAKTYTYMFQGFDAFNMKVFV